MGSKLKNLVQNGLDISVARAREKVAPKGMGQRMYNAARDGVILVVKWR
jgi:hypothetical protein